ncbi:hypothetical protein PM3016_4625 [Paenibacillus mucilaginosus 3016]|uniref:DinB-like domain-containing protein n=1 Tax=Paenibacillus mucilaginosus 3016 TaxID=1116391 RepID=H6NDN1_9BACL|nr:DinB family protein [Paenibacillus mucilaginosus]AFC31371.1 hypothetical protein PM3016_4625 [Paenibacillus mucilaginosus 3016]
MPGAWTWTSAVWTRSRRTARSAGSVPLTWSRRGEKSPEEVRVLLQEQFRECAACLEQLKKGEGTLYTTMMSVNNLGKIDVYQYLYFLCLHAERHLGQLQRVEAEYLAAAG